MVLLTNPKFLQALPALFEEISESKTRPAEEDAKATEGEAAEDAAAEAEAQEEGAGEGEGAAQPQTVSGPSGSVYITMKRVGAEQFGGEAGEFLCLIRAKTPRQKISTTVARGNVISFNQQLTDILRNGASRVAAKSGRRR